jgi:hypothetical protein
LSIHWAPISMKADCGFTSIWPIRVPVNASGNSAAAAALVVAHGQRPQFHSDGTVFLKCLGCGTGARFRPLRRFSSSFSNTCLTPSMAMKLSSVPRSTISRSRRWRRRYRTSARNLEKSGGRRFGCTAKLPDCVLSSTRSRGKRERTSMRSRGLHSY